jgi:hypothetical protein
LLPNSLPAKTPTAWRGPLPNERLPELFGQRVKSTETIRVKNI